MRNFLFGFWADMAAYESLLEEEAKRKAVNDYIFNSIDDELDLLQEELDELDAEDDEDDDWLNDV